LCGLSRATGRVVVTMDDDLQHPPEELPKLIAPVDRGVDLVVGAFDVERKGLGVLGGRLVDAMLRRIYALPPDFKLTSLRAMSGAVARQAAQMTGAYPYVTAMVLSHATTCENVSVAHHPRAYGTSNYGFSRSLRLAFNLLLNYSPYPLYAMTAICVMGFVVFSGLAMWVLSLALSKDTVPGWASILVTIAFSNTMVTLSLLIQFLYITRMSNQIGRSRISYAIAEADE